MHSQISEFYIRSEIFQTLFLYHTISVAFLQIIHRWNGVLMFAKIKFSNTPVPLHFISNDVFFDYNYCLIYTTTTILPIIYVILSIFFKCHSGKGNVFMNERRMKNYRLETLLNCSFRLNLIHSQCISSSVCADSSLRCSWIYDVQY